MKYLRQQMYKKGMKLSYHWVWQAYLNMSVHYFKIEVLPKYIFSLIKIFKIARQTLFVYLCL